MTVRRRLSLLCASLLPVALMASGLAMPGASAAPPSTPPPIPGASGAEPRVSPDRVPVELPLVKVPGMRDAPAGEGLARYTQQKVLWQPCNTGQECASIAAPMDYANPDGLAITLRIARRHTSQPKKFGSVLINPGGPGQAGLEWANVWLPGWDNYDVVAFDPRGTGQSTPVRCYADQDKRLVPESERLYTMDNSPDTVAEMADVLTASRAFNESCATHSGVYLQSLTTRNVIQDMDLIRELVGDKKLHYVGISYGTYLGAMYAHYYPSRVGRLVLDSPFLVGLDDGITQVAGFSRAFDAFAEWEAKNGALGSTAEQVRQTVRGMLMGLDSKPVQSGSRTLTQAMALLGVLTPLYGDESAWKSLESALVKLRKGNARELIALADQMAGRGENAVFDTSTYAFPIMSCLDSPDKGLKFAEKQWRDQAKQFPVLGDLMGVSATCEQFVVPPMPKVTPDASAAAAPILVVAGTGDPATPYEWGPLMVKALGPKAGLLTYDGPGHGAYIDGNECIISAVSRYIRSGELPAPGTVCKH